MLYLRRQQSNTWKARLVGALGTINNNFVGISIYPHICFTNHLSIDRGDIESLEKLFGLLQVKDAAPLVLSQQYDAQQNLPDKVFHVTGWECSYDFLVEATTLAFCRRGSL